MFLVLCCIVLIPMLAEIRHKEVVGRVLEFFSKIASFQNASDMYMQDFYTKQKASWTLEFDDKSFQSIMQYIYSKGNAMRKIQSTLNKETRYKFSSSIVEPVYSPLMDGQRSLATNHHRIYSFAYPSSVDISTSCISYPSPVQWKYPLPSLYLDFLQDLKLLVSTNITPFLGVGEQAFFIGNNGDTRMYPCQSHMYRDDGRYTTIFRSLYTINSSKSLDVLIESSILAGKRRRLVSRIIAATLINSFREGTKIRIFTISDKLTKIYEGTNNLLNLSLLKDYDHVDGYYVRHSVLLGYLSELTSDTRLVAIIVCGIYSRSRRFMRFNAPPNLDIYFIQTQSTLDQEGIFTNEVTRALKMYNFSNGDVIPESVSQETILTCKFIRSLVRGRGYTDGDRINNGLKQMSADSNNWLKAFHHKDGINVLNFTNLTHSCITTNLCSYRTELEPLLENYRATKVVMTQPSAISSAHAYKFMPFLAMPLMANGSFVGVIGCSIDIDSLISLSSLNTFYYHYGSINLIDFSTHSILYSTDYGDWSLLKNYTDTYSDKTFHNPKFVQLRETSQMFNVFLSAQKYIAPTLHVDSAFVAGIGLYSLFTNSTADSKTPNCYSNVLYEQDASTDPKITYNSASKLIVNDQDKYKSVKDEVTADSFTHVYFVCDFFSPGLFDTDSRVSLLFIIPSDIFISGSLTQSILTQDLSAASLKALLSGIGLTPDKEEKFLENLSVEFAVDLIKVYINGTQLSARNFLSTFWDASNVISALKKIVLADTPKLVELAPGIGITVDVSVHSYMRLVLVYLKKTYHDIVVDKDMETKFAGLPNKICSSYYWFGRFCVTLSKSSHSYARAPMMISKLYKASLTRSQITFYTSNPEMYFLKTYFVTIYSDPTTFERGITIGRNRHFNGGKPVFTNNLLSSLNASVQRAIAANNGTSNCVFDCFAEKELASFDPATFNQQNIMLDTCIGSNIMSRLDKYGIIGVPDIAYENTYLTSSNQAYRSFTVYVKQVHPFTGHLYVITSLHIDADKFYSTINTWVSQDKQCLAPNCSIVILNDYLYSVYNKDIANIKQERLYTRTRDAELSNSFCANGVYDLSFNGVVFEAGMGYISPIMNAGSVCIQYAMTPDILTYSINLTLPELNEVDKVWGIGKTGLYLRYSSNERSTVIKRYGQTLCLKSYTAFEQALTTVLSSTYSFEYSNKNITATGYRIAEIIQPTTSPSQYSLHIPYPTALSGGFIIMTVAVLIILVLINIQILMKVTIGGLHVQLYLSMLFDR